MYGYNNLYCPLDRITLIGIFVWKLRHFQKDDTIKMVTLSPLSQKQQRNAPLVPSPENIDYDDVLYM